MAFTLHVQQLSSALSRNMVAAKTLTTHWGTDTEAEFRLFILCHPLSLPQGPAVLRTGGKSFNKL